ncbi:uncharacterized protein LOC128767497 [Synchiropus splendidus]|uniref:uncharacterized protein LOC128767497 n=1 Tax=Synchiropus splendidus TaxID=270530 RepID=UPI00237E467E|nr:uncharacterized protein LOC128767497 [Synchiropus splendidus]
MCSMRIDVGHMFYGKESPTWISDLGASKLQARNWEIPCSEYNWNAPSMADPIVNTLDASTYSVDEDCKTVASLVVVLDEDSADSLGPSPSLPDCEKFDRAQTLYLIDVMRQYLQTEAGGRPRTLKELHSCLRAARSNMKVLWKETAAKLSTRFNKPFCPDKVARKWNTLLDGYKKIKVSNRAKGSRAIRFKFYSEMDSLFGEQHDVVFPVVGTHVGLDMRRPEMIAPPFIATARAEPAACSSTEPPQTPCTAPRQKRQREDDILRYLRESEAASQRRHEELLAQLQSSQKGFESLMNRLIDKL